VSDTRPMAEWDDMLAEFRALGGVADNVCRRAGPLGLGIFPQDSAHPIRIAVPPNLLVLRQALAVRDGALKVAATSSLGAREARFIEDYYAAFSWGGGGREEVARFVAALDALPRTVRDILARECAAGWMFAGSAASRIEKRFLGSRAVQRQGQAAMAPLVELLNHAPDGADYEIGDGVAVAGRFAGEALAAYQHADAFQMFIGWGFASPEPRAFSLPVFVDLSGRVLVVHRAIPPGGRQAPQDAPPKPAVRGRFVDLPFALLGDRAAPERPRALFALTMMAIGEPDADRLFDRIVAINRDRFASLAAAAEGDGAGAAMLRDVCRHQLAALASS